MISREFVDKYSAQAIGNSDANGMLSNVDDFLASSVTDIGTALFNSVVSLPKLFGINTDEYRVETYDVLKSVNEDWANYYNESKDLVETASFIGGMLLPAGLAFKGMKALQAGKLGFYPTALSDVAQSARTTELVKLLELGKKSTSEYRNLRWKILAANAGQETLQAAGAELAILATLNQHAWMEDYLKDPVQNMAISLGIGGVLGAGIGQIVVRKQLRDKLGDVASAATDKVISQIVDIPLGITDVDKVQRYSLNAKILRDIAVDEEQTPLTRQIADYFAGVWEGQAGRLEQTTVFGPALKAIKQPEVLQNIRQVLLSDAAYGANRVDLLTYDPKLFTKQKGHSGSLLGTGTVQEAAQRYEALWSMGKAIQQSLTVSEGLKNFSPQWAKLMKEDFNVFYSPYHKAWIPNEDIANYARAVDTGKTTWERVNVYKPNPDAFSEFAVRGTPTATADAYWINTLGTVAATSLESSVYIMKGDLGVQNGWLSRLSGLASEGKPLPKIFLIDESLGASTVADMRKKATQIDLDTLEANLLEQKEAGIRALLNEGASLQEIGIRMNVPTNVLERMLMEGNGLKAASTQDMVGPGITAGSWRAYVSAAAIDTEYMSQASRTLSFTTNGHRLASLSFRNADMSAMLDAKFIKQQNRELMADVVASGGSEIAQAFFQTLNKDNKIWDLFEQQLANVVNEKSGSFFFSSADFASRGMGDIGRIASVKGQEFFGIANNTSQKLLTNLSAKVRAITQTQVGINEFNNIVNLLQSTSGYRNIDPVTGTLYRMIEQSPGVFFKEPLKDQFGQELAMSPGMRDFLLEMKNVSEELWKMKNTLNKIQGFKELNDIGLWIPSFNPVGKFLSYVIDTEATEGRVKMLIAKTPEQLADLEKNWKAQNGNDKRYKLITKAEQEDYNFWQMRTDPTEMDFSDISKFHSGAAGSAVQVFDDTFASTIVENLHNRVIFYGRKMQEMYLDDIMSTLDNISALNQKYTANQPTLLRAAGLAQREDAARAIKNTILGNNNLGQFSTWQSINNGFASMVEFGSRKTQELYRGLFEFDETKRVLKKGEFVKYAKELESIGIKNPFKDFNDYIGFQAKAAERSRYKLVEDRVTPDDLRYREGFEYFEFIKDGKENVKLEVKYDEAARNIYVGWVGSKDGPRSLGTFAMRELGVQLRAKFPNAQTLSGQRISGVREKISKQRMSAEEQEITRRTGMDPNSVEYMHLEAGGFMDDARGDLDFTSGTAPTVIAPLPTHTKGFMNKEAIGDMLERTRVQEMARRHGVSYDSAERIIAAGNSVLATMALRVMEVGHAVTTAISWPIMMLPEFYRKMPKTYLGNALGEGIEVAFPARAIYDGIRFRNSPMAKPLIERWIAEGFGTSIVSEATRLNQLIATGGKGTISEINKLIEGPLVKTLSKPSDFAESESRLWVLSIGYQMARRMYPGISDSGADLFAKEFLTKTVGNYYSAQRPALFQGTLGVAIGLFQTYMLTWAQQAFRSIEERQFKALASQMLAQAGLFGAGSTPMYDVFSKTIGEHFSDKHYDLSSGTYRALPDPLAEFVVYGLPASLGVGLYTRGDMQPRIPFTQDSPLDTIAAINAARQFIGATGHTLSKVMDANGMGDKFRGLLEGMAMQSLSRPLARIVETVPLPDGQGGFRAVGAISREGNTIATSEEIWSGPGLMSRLMASRSTEEQVKREVDYLNTFYGASDARNRKSATESLKSAIRGGTLTSEKLEETATRYLRTGTATGWKAALNEALATSEGGIDYKLGKRLRPDSPLLQMIDENY